jgi:hypothetical protein
LPPKPPRKHHVVVEEHSIAGGRWRIGHAVLTVAAVDEQDAVDFATTLLHAEAGVPPWRPLRRETAVHAHAELVSPAAAVRELPVPGSAQLVLAGMECAA